MIVLLTCVVVLYTCFKFTPLLNKLARWFYAWGAFGLTWRDVAFNAPSPYAG